MGREGVALAVEGAGGVRKLAAAVGVHHSRVSRWPRVPRQHLFRVASCSGVDASDLRPDLAQWIAAREHEEWLQKARVRLGMGALAGARATVRGPDTDTAIMDVLDLGLVIAAVRFVAREKGLSTSVIIGAKGGAGGAPTPEQSARTLAVGLAVTVGRVAASTVASVMGGSRQSIDNAAERYLRQRDGDDPEDMVDGQVVERGRLRRAKSADDSLWSLQRRFAADLAGAQ